MRETTWKRWLAAAARSPFAAILAIGAFLAFLGPFGSDAMSWPLRLTYWIGLVALGGLGGWLAAGALQRHAAGVAAFWTWAVATVAAAAPVALVLIALNGAAAGRVPPVGWMLQLCAYALVVSAGVTTVSYLIARARDGDGKANVAAADPERAPFLDRLPAKLTGAQVFAVQAEDHYLRVHTSAGDDLILLRLSDAERELAPLDGLRVHRSWWVAREGVDEILRANGRLTLKLKNGAEAPVSRTYARAVRDAGWI